MQHFLKQPEELVVSEHAAAESMVAGGAGVRVQAVAQEALPESGIHLALIGFASLGVAPGRRVVDVEETQAVEPGHETSKRMPHIHGFHLARPIWTGIAGAKRRLELGTYVERHRVGETLAR